VYRGKKGFGGTGNKKTRKARVGGFFGTRKTREKKFQSTDCYYGKERKKELGGGWVEWIHLKCININQGE